MNDELLSSDTAIKVQLEKHWLSKTTYLKNYDKYQIFVMWESKQDITDQTHISRLEIDQPADAHRWVWHVG